MHQQHNQEQTMQTNRLAGVADDHRHNQALESSLVSAVRAKAEGYFQRGEFFCSEAVLHTINELLGWPFPAEITKLASSFPIGIGKSGCLCGAVSGGAMALGMVYGRNHGEAMNDKMFPVAAGLHDHVKAVYKSTCCRVLVKGYDFGSPERKAHCVRITGEVAAWVAARLAEDPEVAARLSLEGIAPESLLDAAASASENPA
ncbi:C-GCAxxG-C-C family protein [Acidaminobacter hydrogenoformans]|uniref:C_GCAxxG_C_C family probable redox protein n=1 Tax=Acidaminobacter hydrogenoformans DSM 2784 TaxID=1120920 RepID=A0A1G5RXA9_9FIRM|nr:C-GCAxxG-C-C family protein [Acidaminobacter hydrogenoformans]SCZ78754.1 C_GCAxxG_C_C family probable redox protein [Acidaminobacter hydrogenoformans DSM 2784]